MEIKKAGGLPAGFFVVFTIFLLDIPRERRPAFFAPPVVVMIPIPPGAAHLPVFLVPMPIVTPMMSEPAAAPRMMAEGPKEQTTHQHQTETLPITDLAKTKDGGARSEPAGAGDGGWGADGAGRVILCGSCVDACPNKEHRFRVAGGEARSRTGTLRG